MENSLKATICPAIKELRKKHGYSQEDMAIALNMQQNTYSRMKRGETKLDIERLQQIASFYKTYLHDLLNKLSSEK